MEQRAAGRKPEGFMGKVFIVMEKTIRDLMSFRRLVVVIVVGLLPALLIGATLSENYTSGTMSLEMQTHTLSGTFMLFSFIWIAGFYVVYMIISSGIDFISKEEDNGTLLILISKPISRFQFVLGKFLALLVTSLLLQIVVLFGSIVIFWALLGLENETVRSLTGMVFWIFLYSIIVAILFCALTAAASAMFRGRAIKMVVAMFLVVLAFGVGPILRMGWPGIYDNLHLYYVDPGYHLGNAFVSISEPGESGRITPQSQALLGILTGTYEAGMEEAVLAMFIGSSESFDPDIRAMPVSLERTNYFPPLGSVLLSLIVSAVALAAARVAIEKKEVF